MSSGKNKKASIHAQVQDGFYQLSPEHLNHMRKLQLQARPPVIRNSPDYRCTTDGKAYGVGVNRRLDLDCKPK